MFNKYEIKYNTKSDVLDFFKTLLMKKYYIFFKLIC